MNTNSDTWFAFKIMTIAIGVPVGLLIALLVYTQPDRDAAYNEILAEEKRKQAFIAPYVEYNDGDLLILSSDYTDKDNLFKVIAHFEDQGYDLRDWQAFSNGTNKVYYTK